MCAALNQIISNNFAHITKNIKDIKLIVKLVKHYLKT